MASTCSVAALFSALLARRTALALLAGAVAITQLVPDLGVPLARQIIARIAGQLNH